MTAKSVYAAAAPDDRPVTASIGAPFGVASYCTVKEPFWVANAVFCNATTLVTHVPGGGGAETVSAAVPLCPSLVAVIVPAPAAPPATSPLPLPVATAGLPLAHVTVRPVSGLPLASLGVAVSCTVMPSFTLADGGATVTDATGAGVTVIAAVPLSPSDVAVIVAEPVATAVTRPLAPTVATVTFELDHATARPVNGLPLASLGVAASCTVSPTATLAVAGVTATDATGTLATVTLAAPLCPSHVAVIVAAPNPTAVTSPLPPTVATAALLLAHVTNRPDSGAT